MFTSSLSKPYLDLIVVQACSKRHFVFPIILIRLHFGKAQMFQEATLGVPFEQK
jgi:hypothetical protein